MANSSHALLSVFLDHGIDRVFLVPGESYLGILDALCDFPGIDAVTCRHESGAGFMAVADARLSGRPGIALVSRGPGATNASIAVHTAQQDALPLVLIVGQVPRADLRREAFQEIDYQRMYGSIAKWVFEATEPGELAAAAFKAIRIATSGTPGPVVLVIPEDVQQQQVEQPRWIAREHARTKPDAATMRELLRRIDAAERPLIVAGGAFEASGGREALAALAEAWEIPVALSFRRHDLFSNLHPLYVGELGLANPKAQIDAFRDSDLLLALGTRFGDVTSQGYSFPDLPRPAQTFVHAYADAHVVGLHFAPDFGLVCDPIELARSLTPGAKPDIARPRAAWTGRLKEILQVHAAWPQRKAEDGIDFVQVVKAVRAQASADAIVCLDAGTFAAPVYRHFGFVPPQRLMSPLSGTMGYGTPAAIAAQLRFPGRQVICMVGDGGFMMTGNEMIAAVERKLPILFILANNGSYASIRIQQELHYPGRVLGTSLFNPDFEQIARAFGMRAQRVVAEEEVAGAVARGLAAGEPYFIEVKTSLAVTLPQRRSD
ncbi:MAG: thiamine pyrophosphate-binding protein [Betaproteobacteria bacterium]|nr:thiamine pyrophosphate-binding protein [Betaproteobacteria bacterium]